MTLLDSLSVADTPCPLTPESGNSLVQKHLKFFSCVQLQCLAARLRRAARALFGFHVQGGAPPSKGVQYTQV